MRTEEEIQHAHDFLQSILVYDNELDPKDRMDADLKMKVHLAHDAMGWALGHECGKAFGENMENLRQALDKAGFKLIAFKSHPE